MGMPVVGGGERPLADFHAFCSKCGREVRLLANSEHERCDAATLVVRTLDGAALDEGELVSERPGT